MNNNFLSSLDKASKIIEKYTYPLLRVDEHEFPDIFASCFFLEVDSLFYLVTAAHAIRGNLSNLFTTSDDYLIKVVGHANITTSSEKDHIDIAAIHIDEKIIRENDINVIPQSMLITSVEVMNPHSRAVSGFPCSMNKQKKTLNKKDKIWTGKCYTFFECADFRGDYLVFNKSPKIHIGIEFEPGVDDLGKNLSTPPWPPRGVSGGGAWLIPDLSQPELVFLEGVFIEVHKRAKKLYTFSTRLEYVVGFIDQTHNNRMH